MYFLIERKLLYQSLQKIVSVVSSRARLPILSHILLKVSKNCLFITATNLDVEITVQWLLDDGTYSDGLSTVSGRKLFDICRGLSEDVKISMELKNNKLVINSGCVNFSLSTFSASDFPKLESWASIITLEISQIVLKKMMELTQFSMGNQDVRYYLNGMFFEIKNNLFCIVTTDGHRLAMCSIFLDKILSSHSVIIPRKSVCEILRFLNFDKHASLINIQISNRSIYFKINNYTIMSNLVDGIFPEYHNLFIEQSKNVLEILCDNLKKALKRAAIVSSEKFKVVRFILMKNLLKIVARNFEDEMSEESLDVMYIGKDMEISFNINYLLDILNVIDTQIIRFLLTDATSIVHIEGITKYYNETYIVMPVRI